jgi:hypothetical protein
VAPPAKEWGNGENLRFSLFVYRLPPQGENLWFSLFVYRLPPQGAKPWFSLFVHRLLLRWLPAQCAVVHCLRYPSAGHATPAGFQDS